MKDYQVINKGFLKIYKIIYIYVNINIIKMNKNLSFYNFVIKI